MEQHDEDLARAIALSLQDSRKPITIIDVDADESESEKTSSQDQPRRPPDNSKSKASKQSTSSGATTSQELQVEARPGVSEFLRERAKLERERRERQKRLRNVSDSDHQDSDEDETAGPPPAKSADEQYFWNGELRPIANQHAEPRLDGKPTFRLTTVLGNKSELAFAIMSSYSLDFAWIYEFFDRNVPVIMVAQPDSTGRPSLKNVLPNWIKTTPALRDGRGCMHMKFMLLFYKTGRLRVVVTTANLIAYDYRDIENTLWLQDFPLRSRPIAHDSKAFEDFPSVLQHVLNSVNVKPALSTMINTDHPNLPLKSIEELRMRWDWSKIKVHLIHSLAGRHEGWPSVIRTGHPRLMKIIRNMGLRTGRGKGDKELVLECQGSSLGVYSTQWMNEFHWSARGESGEDWLDESKKRRERLPYPPIKIIFPSKKIVQESKLGEQGGGTIFCRRRQWSAKNFPRNHFHESKSKGGPVLMHSKMIIALKRDWPASTNPADGSDTEDDDDELELIEPAVGWAYVGSHNFTPSAWGNLSGSAFNPILNISNYELGIVFPLKSVDDADKVACWQRPPRKYVSGTDDPWIQEESVYHQHDDQ